MSRFFRRRATTPSGASAATRPVTPIPLIARDFADPDVLRSGDTWLAYSTNSVYDGRLWHVPVQRAPAVTGPWTPVGDAMPTLPAWVDPAHPNVWAPELCPMGDGRVLLYFTARNARLGVQCIGVAVSDTPTGPFVALGDGPIAGRVEDGDTLDAESFTDGDGSRWLIYKSGRVYSTMWLQRLTPDGLGTVGPRTEMIRSDRPDEGIIVEAPTVLRRAEGYVLLYSANSYDSGSYHVNWATAPRLAGPWTKAAAPLLTTDTIGRAYPNPGHQDAIGPYLVFHATTGPAERGMFLLALAWDRGTPTVVAPRSASQLA